MSEFKLTTVDEFEAATARLLETGAKVGADAWQLRVKNQTPHCKFGEQGICCRICSMGPCRITAKAPICCRICSMGPCRITAKAPRGICGCDAHGIVGRNYLKFTAGGASAHSDHGREICHTLHCAAEDGNYKVKDPEKLIRIAGRNYLKFTAGGASAHSDHGREICHTLHCAAEDGNYKVKDPEKLIRIAKEWGVETEGKDIYDLAHEMAEMGLMEYGKPFGYQRFLDRMPAGQRIAKEWGVETEGKDIYDLAHEMAEMGLMEYGKPFGYQRFLDRMPAGQKEKLIENEIAPRAIDREVSSSLHMTHMGCSSLPEALVKQSIRCGLADGWGGSMMGTEFSDVLFGTPKPIDTEANLGVMVEENVNIVVHGHDPSDGWGGSMMGTEFSDVLFGTPKPIDTEANLGVMVEENVNIVVHGHDPSLSEMICEYADSKEMIDYAKSVGAKGITVSGVCCTSNEVAMRRGIPMAGNFLQQENVVLTGACEAIVVDVQCIFPALGPLSKCFHTKFITTSPIAQMPDSDFIRFSAETAGENAKAIVKLAIDNFKNRKPELVHIPQLKQKATVGYSVEAIVKTLDGVTNSQVDVTGTTKPLLECITSGVIRGAVAMVGCNNPKIRPDYAHIELMKKCIANDIVIIASGCSAQAAAKAGLMDKSAKDLCGAGLKRVCELADIPPVLHMGSCVDISRMMILAAELAKDAGLQIHQLPVVGCAPEWMSEKAVSIGNYVIGTGIDTFLGVDPYVSGSSEMAEILTEGTRKWVDAAFTVETDIEKLVDLMIERIEEKRTALGI